MCPRNVSDTTQTSYIQVHPLLFLAEFQFYEGQRFLTFWVRTCGMLRRLILTRQGSSARLFGKLGFIFSESAVPGFRIFWLISWGGGHLQDCVRRIQAQAHRAPRLFSSSTGAICTKIGQCHVWPGGAGQGGPTVTPATTGGLRKHHDVTRKENILKVLILLLLLWESLIL